MNNNVQSSNNYNKWIIILSIVIPLIVALLFGVNLKKMGYKVEPLTFLPPIYASINAITSLVLISAVWFIKNGKRKLHQTLMKLAICFSALFLVMYMAYHMTSESTKFGGEGNIRYVYYFVLITHICLSVIVIPFVLITFVRGLTADFERHKKIARYTFPLWLYVTVSGVIVYLMISPYYS